MDIICAKCGKHFNSIEAAREHFGQCKENELNSGVQWLAAKKNKTNQWVPKKKDELSEKEIQELSKLADDIKKKTDHEDRQEVADKLSFNIGEDTVVQNEKIKINNDETKRNETTIKEPLPDSDDKTFIKRLIILGSAFVILAGVVGGILLVMKNNAGTILDDSTVITITYSDEETDEVYLEGINYQHYQSNQRDFSLDYPEGWEIQEHDTVGSDYVVSVSITGEFNETTSSIDVFCFDEQYDILMDQLESSRTVGLPFIPESYFEGTKYSRYSKYYEDTEIDSYLFDIRDNPVMIIWKRPVKSYNSQLINEHVFFIVKSFKLY